MPDVTIRRARTADAERLADLWLALLRTQAEQDDRIDVSDDAAERWHNDFPVWLDDETRRIFVAELDTAEGREGEVCAFASAHRWGPPPIYAESEEVYLDEIYVAPDAQRQGIGGQLVDAVREWAEGLGAQRVRAQVLASNDAGNAFWDAQDAAPLTITRAIECSPEPAESREGTKKIGF
jgi:GNAT superfamily N-acetyltransferase